MSVEVLELGELHPDAHDYPEGMFVTNGTINMLVDGKAIVVNEGGMLIVPPHTLHTVLPAATEGS